MTTNTNSNTEQKPNGMWDDFFVKIEESDPNAEWVTETIARASRTASNRTKAEHKEKTSVFSVRTFKNTTRGFFRNLVGFEYGDFVKITKVTKNGKQYLCAEQTPNGTFKISAKTTKSRFVTLPKGTIQDGSYTPVFAESGRLVLEMPTESEPTESEPATEPATDPATETATETAIESQE